MAPGNNIILNDQARQMLYNVFCFMKKEAEESGTGCAVTVMYQRTADATKTSVSTVKRILKEAKETDGVFSTPGQTRLRKKPITGLDSNTQEYITKFIQDYQEVKKKEISLPIILKKLQTVKNFQGSENSLRRILKELGFEWRKISDGLNKRMLVKKTNAELKQEHSEDNSDCDDNEGVSGRDSEMNEVEKAPTPTMDTENKGNIEPIWIKKELEEDENKYIFEIELIKSEPIDT